MKRVVSVVGARPNFMKVAPIDRAFKKYSDKVEHLIVHTGQHYDAKMSDAFFQDLEMPEPAVFLGIGSGSHADQTAKVIMGFEKVCLDLKPDLVIVVGDVNSTIACTLTAVKLEIPVAHVEAGLRSGDRKMPEEINRLATDAICDYCFVTEESGMKFLKESHFPEDKTFFVGNTMIDSQHFALAKAEESNVLKEIGIEAGKYVLVTLHRPSNVDEPEQLQTVLKVLAELSQHRAVVFPVHPRTRKNIESFGLNELLKNVHFIDAQGYIDFLALMKNADFVLTDSGGIQEETTALKIPCITVRTTTERPVTCEIGTNILIEPTADAMKTAIDNMLNKPRKAGAIPPMWDGRAAERITEIIVSQILNV
ncbi:MAG: UDP-N-acetylglucosamine 2-epimerase (non-hydrolyzing) [Bacteroidota bacterium]